MTSRQEDLAPSFICMTAPKPFIASLTTDRSDGDLKIRKAHLRHLRELVNLATNHPSCAHAATPLKLPSQYLTGSLG
jgi:hypothetical protein